MSMALFVGRLPRDFRNSELEDVFYKYGKITRCEVKRGASYAYGFVEFDDKRDAYDALDDTDGMYIDGVRIVVERAKSRARREGDDTCFRCGEPGHWARDCRNYGRRRSRSYSRSPRRHRDRSPSYSRSRSRSYSRSRSPRRSRGRSVSRSVSPRDRSYSRSPYRSRSRSLSRGPSRSRSRSRSAPVEPERRDDDTVKSPPRDPAPADLAIREDQPTPQETAHQETAQQEATQQEATQQEANQQEASDQDAQAQVQAQVQAQA
ncbi:uncharacterized protein BYT42DRAFT_133601 [Radiomyces spectabilis]|uniref:uncharacterized protein n=1 Tax=Radiomyces spectabilis TaxID=64574 RepID=UPI0022202918|nr:uncharacterized protein BYT42DRAFT_133601 [Radiomyces spectabilis]KAI8367631.1 hypothetical protein BYT42DRAFT_133601 [Radiomyces spectabilis]